ncbi:methyltransferase-like protein 17, mitochondrial [Tanacetum coccineum]|uniref:Methyltransferase-like protein 17, mitochondrial n=1 Tax=Tanacetum coccineum TaxID=301880 RepID=A0ABQ5IFR9_9ASTR
MKRPEISPAKGTTKLSTLEVESQSPLTQSLCNDTTHSRVLSKLSYSESWPLDGMKFDTLKEQKAKRKPEDIESDHDEGIESEPDDIINDRKMVIYESDINEPYFTSESDSEEETPDESTRADLGTGWGRIVFSPMKRGKMVEMDVCRATNQEGTEGRFERVIVTKSKNPTLHRQAKKSLWDDESKHGARILNDGAQNSNVESDDECNVDGVSETVFSDNMDKCNVDGHGKETDKQQSVDPFGFYDLLNKLPANGVRDATTSLSHPPGFTPKTSVTHANVGEICEDGPTNGEDMVNMPRVDAKVMDHSQEVHDSSNGESVSSFSHKVHNGGSILDILDDMVRVGHSMGYNLDGCLKDMERIIGSQGDEDVLK